MSPAPAAHAERLLEYVRILAPLVEAERHDLDTKRELSPSLLDALHTLGGDLEPQRVRHRDHGLDDRRVRRGGGLAEFVGSARDRADFIGPFQTPQGI